MDLTPGSRRKTRRSIAHPAGAESDTLKIGQLARRAAVSVDAVRFYERRGILPRPQRRPSGYRIYREADVDRLRMTKALQKLGFTLEEVKSALDAFDTGSATCASERWRLQAVLGRIDAKIAELQHLRAAVAFAFESCRAGRCPVLPTPGESRSGRAPHIRSTRAGRR